MALYRNTEDRTNEVNNAQNTELTVNDLREAFPNQNDLIDELIGVGDFIKALRKFSRGLINSRELEDSDDSIYKVKPSEPLGQSTIIIDFGDDAKFFKSLDISEDDQWFLNGINSHYSYEFMDSYQVEQDFKEGYIIFNKKELNTENIEKLKEIAELILPNEEFNLEDDEYKVKLSNTLLTLFNDEIDSILGDYQSEKNNEMLTTAKRSTEDEINNFLESIGFQIHRDYDLIATTPGNLVMWSVRLNLPKIDAISLFNQIIEEVGTSLGRWAEYSYEFQDFDNFDLVSFNNYVERQFNQILETLEEDEESGGEKIKEFLGFRNRIIKKFTLDEWYILPSDKKVSFRVEGFDREDMKVIIQIKKENRGSYRKLELSEENFNNLLYNLQLFDLFDV
jgi:hypothetical protein